MTTQAIIVPLKSFDAPRLLRQGVEGEPILWVLCREFDESTTHPSDRYRVIEEHTPWIRGGDLVGLKACFGEHDNLRFHRNIQGVEHGTEIAASTLKG